MRASSDLINIDLHSGAEKFKLDNKKIGAEFQLDIIADRDSKVVNIRKIRDYDYSSEKMKEKEKVQEMGYETSIIM